MENLTIIVAIGRNNELGKDNNLIWHLPEDLQFFKAHTTGKQILMGKRTLDSLPRLLPNRKHLVLTSQNIEESDQLQVFHDIASVTAYLEQLGEEVMVIGGAQIYNEFLPLSDKMLLTEVDAEDKEADAYFPTFDRNDWNSEVLSSHEHKDIKYKHLVYTRKSK